MSASDARQCLSVPGRLYYGARAASALGGPPYGGLELGIKSDFRLEIDEEFTPLMDEAQGVSIGSFRGFQTFRMAFILVQYDPDLLKRLFRVDTTQVTFPGANTIKRQPVGSIPNLDVIAHIAENPEHPSVVFPAPVPYKGKGAQLLNMSLNKPLEFGCMFWANKPAGGEPFLLGKIQDLTW